MLRVTLVWTLVLAGCGGAQRPTGRADREYLAEIKVDGNHGIATTDLVPGLTLHRAQEGGRPPDPFELAQDVERIKSVYQKLGYFSVDVKGRIDHNGQASTVVFTIVEGKRATVHLEIRGIALGPLYNRLRASMTLVEGAPFDYDVYDDTKTAIETFLHNESYAYAEVDGDVDADKEHAIAEVQLVIRSGEPCTFGNITIAGTSGALAGAVRDRIAFEPGQPYSNAALEDTHKAISQFGRFSSVRIKPGLETNQTVVPITIAVAEGDRHEVRIGGGIGLDPLTWEARGRFGYSVTGPHLGGHEFPLTTFAADAKPAEAFVRENQGWTPDFSQHDLRLRATLNLRRADLFRTYMTGLAEVGVTYTTVEAYTSYGPYLRLGLSTPLGAKFITVRAGWQLELLYFRDINGAVDDATRSSLGISTAQLDGVYQQAIEIDLRDQPVQSRSGVYAKLQVNEGTPYAGGELSYVELQPELRAFLPLGPMTLATRFRLGAFIGDVPVTQRFFDGGATSQRGFPARTLAPSAMALGQNGNILSVVIGGGASIETGVELRVPIGAIYGFDLELVPFLDGADVTGTPSQLNISNLHWATGGGLHWVSKYGSVGVDVGYRLNRKGPTEPNPGESWSWNLSIGEAY